MFEGNCDPGQAVGCCIEDAKETGKSGAGFPDNSGPENLPRPQFLKQSEVNF